MAKHHPSLDLSGLAVDDIKKELMSSKAIVENVTEEAIHVAKGMKEATIITPADPVPNEQQSFFFFFLFRFFFFARQEQYFSLGSLFWAIKQFLYR